jgi:hypothetical protein
VVCIARALPQVEQLTEQLGTWKQRGRQLEAELRQQQHAQQQMGAALQELQAQHQVSWGWRGKVVWVGMRRCHGTAASGSSSDDASPVVLRQHAA